VLSLSTVINIGAVIVSIVALTVSASLARSQFAAQRHSNHIDPMIGLLNEFRSLEFHRNYQYICKELPALSSEGGISGLDEAVQRKIYDIGYFFQLYAILAYLGVVDRKFMSALLRRRYLETWASLEPFVRKERELQSLSDGAILNIFEHFAMQLRNYPPGEMQKLLDQWRIPE